MQKNQIYSTVASFLLDYHGGWHVRYEADLVKYADTVDDKYGVEVLQGCGKYWIMNVFLLNNGRFLGVVRLNTNCCHKHIDDQACRFIDWWEKDNQSV
jgi:hypothetical protein